MKKILLIILSLGLAVAASAQEVKEIDILPWREDAIQCGGGRPAMAELQQPDHPAARL